VKAHLLYRDRDFDPQRPLVWNAAALVQDLGLGTLFAAMARDDKFVLEVSRRLVLSGLDEGPAHIPYRQDVLRDCLDNARVVRELYAIAVEATEEEKRHYLGSILSTYPGTVLRRSIDLITAYLGMLRKLRRIADSHAEDFRAPGWRALFDVVKRELDDGFFARARSHLAQLKFNNGVLLSAKLATGNKGGRYVLREQPVRAVSWLERLFARLFAERSTAFEFSLHPRDEAGARALNELRDRGIALVASALAQSADHVRSFFGALRTELAFYVGCINLHEQLAHKHEPVCFPQPLPATEHRLSFSGLYEVCLTLGMTERVVGSDANADAHDLVMVTGANQGGKSTFLRSVGIAQLMMQCGMFVAAEAFRASAYDGVFTHFKREEDTAMKSGKLDEELARMSEIVDHITPHPMILFNESFAATNEREGSEIGRQILAALMERGVKIVCVTHLYELARGFYEGTRGKVLFLRANRQADGTRPFRLVEGKPLETSFGEDLYRSIFPPVARETETAGTSEPVQSQ
jgi:hypothetical protein